ncbi:MAG: phosphatidylinositol-specific phospholipase C domain-containing protein [Myxococcota bacterium]|nr:phosphatidylinositol-specific phospholipase C domain-containing protein [Myxococcota bacterium]
MLFLLIACSSEDESMRSYPQDPHIRISDAQVWGTHNSYHLVSENNVIDIWDYSHKPLAEQLDRGIRQFEIDIVYNPEEEEILVQHVPFIDDGSTCYRFRDCLQIMKDWSTQHPWHFPLQILIEPKDEVATWSVIEHLDTVDAQIIDIWGEQLWSPRLQQGDFPELRDSIINSGWPTLEVLRGKAIFVLLDKGDVRSVYTSGDSGVFDRAMFPLFAFEHEMATYFLGDDPFDPEIESWVSNGFLVRTRGEVDLVFDPVRLEQAFDSGAHSISVDTEESLERIDPLHPIRCNPKVASSCRADDLE